MKRVLSREDLPFDVAYPKVEGKCDFCLEPSRGRRRWCSDKCGREAWIMVNLRRGVSTYIRIAVKRRDNGICSQCSADTELIKRIFGHAVKSLQRDGFVTSRSTIPLLEKLWPVVQNTTFWQADHIVEVYAGGEHSLENLQTLCTICHKQKTAAFAAIRAGKSQRHQQQPALFGGAQ